MSAWPRVDLLTTDLDVGGAENQLVMLASELHRRRWPVRVISMIPPGLMRERLAPDVPLLSLEMRRGRADAVAPVRLARMIRANRTEVLLSFLYHANVLGRIAGRLARVPLIISSMRNERFGSTQRDVLLRATDWMGDVNVVNSERAAAELRKRNIVPRRGIMVVPNCIDTTLYERSDVERSRTRAELGVHAATFVWLMVGHLWPQKDHATALHAFSRLSREDTRLVIVGAGPLEDELRDTARALGVDDRVDFLGMRHDVPSLLAAADGFLLTSAWEGLPNVVMEALAGRVPVVATAVGGVPEIIRDGDTGLLVPPRDPAAAADAMARLATLPAEERQGLADRGYRHVRESFGIAATTDMWGSVLTGATR